MLARSPFANGNGRIARLLVGVHLHALRTTDVLAYQAAAGK
jgi:hypothetical protein